MKRDDLLRLAEAVEKLTGPDREVDVRISLGLSNVEHSEEDVADLLRVRDEPTGYGKYRPADEYVPSYTASLDAAMALVPEGWRLELEQHSSSWTAQLANAPWFDDRRQIVDADGPTAALALLSSALRAQAEALA